MNFIIKQKWIVIIVWILVAAGMFMAAPNMAGLVREKGQITVPDEYSSTLAGNIMEEVRKQEGGGDETQVALVFHSEKKLTQAEISEAEKAIRKLEKNRDQIGITNILTHFNEESLKEQLVSKDGKSILSSVTVSWNDREPAEVKKLLYAVIEDVDVDHYYTSQWLINEDLITSSEEGLKKTEGITVVFILVVLLLVFRSVIAPVIPLVTVGMAYFVSQSIVSMLVDQFNFPLSNYTQIFLVAVLFGIGTDYCILLLSRFKEELTHHETVPAAIIATYKNAGRTVFFSGMAVMIGFAAIGFSQFILYQSAAAVAIGVALLLAGLFTIVPFFMALLGPKLFWPSKQSAEHGESKLWGTVGRFSLARPFLSLLIVAAVCVPFLVAYDGKLSYNSLDEISGNVNSIKAFNAIATSFGPGESMPTQIILKNDERMDSAEYIKLAENISAELKKVDMVDTVRSVTRPTGQPIEDFFVSKQAETLGSGLGEGKDGLDKINKGLNEAETELSKSAPELKGAADGINELINGTTAIETGLGDIQTNLVKIEDGIRKGSAGSGEIKAGLERAKAGAEELLAGYQQLQSKYVEMEKGLTELEAGYKNAGEGISHLSSGISQTNGQLFGYLENRDETLKADQTYQEMKGQLTYMQGELAKASAGINQLNEVIPQLIGGMTQANEAFAGALAQQATFGPGLQQLIDGIEQQQAGLNQLADGQGQIVQHFPDLTTGLSSVNAGQQQLLAGFGGLGTQMDQLTDGLSQSTDGLDQVSKGLGSAQEYLTGLASADSNGFYLPEDALKSDEFAQVLDVYFSKDRKVMTMDVIFEANPYSNKAMAQIPALKDAVERATKGTKLENADVAIGGITSTNADLDKMSGQDYTRTVILMLLGIGIILVFLFRSIIMPIYMIGSLILTYYTSMAINEVIYVDILGYSGISWAVPFFAFVILVALGVDYSIFLMDRFNEYKNLSISEAMLLSMKKMGTVIISAAIILGGTFAAMMPSGMMSLLQIASILLAGLFLYAFIMLPLFIPVLVKNFGEANWWPFKRS
ncbi:MMPL family transporter [Mesobacillus stamsii]|uniref:RND superfamily putative drug exporter n=1 Tax=Mesobacillus stamsii TaxID=225347 RepID=A0ABU0FTI3_9BACI|nr:MMPL family transporter [Mesobacillus stamsii]MDQ0412617.1 RND superfamily putative drug exporter [Mesobacillus stamsii]